MTLVVVQAGGEGEEHIATWDLSEYPPVFDGHAVGRLSACRVGAIDAVEELERRIAVLAEWVVENDPRECAECGGAADAVELIQRYPLCSECSTFETRRRYG